MSDVEIYECDQKIFLNLWQACLPVVDGSSSSSSSLLESTILVVRLRDPLPVGLPLGLPVGLLVGLAVGLVVGLAVGLVVALFACVSSPVLESSESSA